MDQCQVNRGALVMCLLCLAATGCSDSFEEGVVAYERGKYELAAESWNEAAERGVVAAQYSLALLYKTGKSVERDFARAAEWYRRASDSGDAQSMYSLGRLYESGQGVPQDPGHALELFRKAAQQGRKAAQRDKPGVQCMLGALYYYGLGVPQDESEAAQWYRKAAEQGDLAGQTNLGMFYRDGIGVHQDNVQAYIWYNLASAQDEDYATTRDAIARDLSPELLAEAQQFARDKAEQIRDKRRE